MNESIFDYDQINRVFKFHLKNEKFGLSIVFSNFNESKFLNSMICIYSSYI